MSYQIAVRIPTDQLQSLDQAVAEGRFPNRSSAIKSGLEHVLREGREQAIADEYRRAYGQHADDKWAGEAGAAAMAEVVAEQTDK